MMLCKVTQDFGYVVMSLQCRQAEAKKPSRCPHIDVYAKEFLSECKSYVHMLVEMGQ